MNFSYIIAYRHSEDRAINLKTILKWVSQFDCEIIIVESDISSKIDIFKEFKLKHIFLENNYPFNKSWCFNVGFKNAINDKIVFGDADLIMDSKSFLSSVELLNSFECVNPYSSVLDLSPQETSNFINNFDMDNLYSISRSGRGENDHQKVPMCGGIIMFQKQSLEKLVGWNEDFWGWGAEDDFMSNKAKLFLNCEDVKDKCYHLYHEKAQIDRNLYYRNLNIYNYFLNVTKEQYIPYFESIKDKIGKIDKKIQ
jgi:predicted glycosyltransferase involved in capsule biosynthesis